MEISCAFATSLQTAEQIRIAESLGYRRAWIYDSPSLYPDVWGMLYLAAERTSTIEIGPGVLVPSLRHPMVNAAAIGGLCAMAPGRVVVAVGSGFTGRQAMGQKPMRWRDVEHYVKVLRALLAGETVEWDGAPIKMLQVDGFAADRPIDIPILIGASGPRGTKIGKAIGEGFFSATFPNPEAEGWHALLISGTVLQNGESFRDDRVIEATGHAIGVAYHRTYERQGPDAVRAMPAGQRWMDSIESIPAAERHLATHERHLVSVNDHDRAAFPEAADLMPTMSLTGSPQEIRDRIDRFAEQGVTELAYQPGGSDIPGELERFIAAANG